VAALKKYGEIKEAEKDGGYFKYELTAVETGSPINPERTAGGQTGENMIAPGRKKWHW
jgi:hypothetical protein